MTAAPPPKKLAILADGMLLVTAMAVLVGLSLLVPRTGFWVVDEGQRYAQMRHIADHHNLRGFSIEYPWQNVDPQGLLNPVVKYNMFRNHGRLYSQYPPAFTYGCAVLSRVIGEHVLWVVPLVSGLVLLLACAFLAKQMNLWPGMAAALAMLCTPVLPYVYTFWDIVPAMALGLWAVALVSTSGIGMGRALFAGVLAGCAFVLREEYLLWAGCIGIALVVERRAWRVASMFASGFAAIAVPLVVFNTIVVGHPLFMLVWKDAVPEVTGMKRIGFVASRYLWNTSGSWAADVALFAAMGALACAWVLPGVWRVMALMAGVAAALYVRLLWWPSAQPLVSQFRFSSMAACAPVAFLGAGWLLKHPRLRGHGAVALVAAVGFLLLTVLLSPPISAHGLNFGPRLLLPVYPVLAVFGMAVAAHTYKGSGRLKTAVVAGLALVFAIGAVDSAFYMHRLVVKKRFSERLVRFAQALAPMPIVTDVDWLGMELARLYGTQPIFGIVYPEQVAPAIRAAQALYPEAAVIVRKKAPAALEAAANLQPLPAVQKLVPPDRLFGFSAVRAVWKPQTSGTRTVMTYNIHGGVPMGYKASEYAVKDADLRAIADLITSEGTSLVAMQEVKCEFTDPNSTVSVGPGAKQAKVIAGHAGMHYVFASTLDDDKGFPTNTEYMEWGGDGVTTVTGAKRGEFGNALLSKEPFITQPVNIPLPNKEGKEQRAAIRAETRDLIVFATHLQNDDAALRVEQMRAIVERAATESSDKTILVIGDLNCSPGGKDDVVKVATEAGFRDGAAEGGRADLTFPADVPKGRIDHVLVHGGMKVTAARVLPVLLSDHRPLVIELK